MSAHSTDPALETLFLPFLADRLHWSERTLFLRARAGAILRARPWPGLVCEQSFKPDADALARLGAPTVAADASTRYPLVLLLPPRQRSEARALMARALDVTAPGGRIVAAASNNEGARSSEDDLSRLAGPLETLTKNKCRVFWTAPLDGAMDTALLTEWRALDAIRPIESGRFMSRPGVFAWDRIDAASALLAAHLPAELSGRAADFGAGFGFLSSELLTRCTGITALDLYEAEARALELARRNLEQFQSRATLNFLWHDLTTGAPHTYDVIVMNPPFHTQNRAERPDVGRRFIVVAAEALKPGGRLWLVANRNLPYESALTEGFGNVRVVAQQGGYKVIEAIKASRTERRR